MVSAVNLQNSQRPNQPKDQRDDVYRLIFRSTLICVGYTQCGRVCDGTFSSFPYLLLLQQAYFLCKNNDRTTTATAE